MSRADTISAFTLGRLRGPIPALTQLVDWWIPGLGLTDSGGLITSWRGAVRGRTLVSAGAARPTRDRFNGLDSPRWLVSGAVNQYLDLTGWAPPNFDHTLHVCLFSDVAATGGVESVLAAGTEQNHVFYDVSGSTWYLSVPAGGARVSPARPAETSTRAVYSFVSGRTYAAIWRNGTRLAEASYGAAAVSTPDTFRLGWLSGGVTLGAYDWSGVMHHPVLQQTIATAAEIRAVHAFLQKELNAP